MLSEVCFSGTPGRIGKIGAVRSRAWIWVFSSTQTTTAFVGGSRYRPTTSRILASSSGSVENLTVGRLTPTSRPISVLLRPSAANNKIRARCAKPAEIDDARAHSRNTFSSPACNTNGSARDMSHVLKHRPESHFRHATLGPRAAGRASHPRPGPQGRRRAGDAVRDLAVPRVLHRHRVRRGLSLIHISEPTRRTPIS